MVEYDVTDGTPRFTGYIHRDVHFRVITEYEPWGNGIRVTDDPRTAILKEPGDTN
ncbi:unnamed protein product [Gemmataceae bacterium]|nr:unnamed protein product [Gemmataceae bacterium]VTU00566.1 unnamed protein product [Gemmataceae bacterium]